MPRTLLPLLLTCLAGSAYAGGNAVTITWPSDYQVFQRDSSNRGQVIVRGSVDAADTKVRARLVSTADNAKVVADWQDLSVEPATRKIEGAIAAPAGGWYRLELKATRPDGSESGSVTVDRVGVGDVFICAGQSNAANAGAVRMKAQDDRVAAFSRRAWSHCDDPQQGASGPGGSPWPVLGDLLVTNLDVPVAIASIAEGGTQIRMWTPDGNPTNYKKIRNVLATLGKNGVKAILWHQGESDASHGTSTADYEAMLTSMIEQSRKDAGYDVQWVVANVSFVPGVWANQRDKCEAVRTAQQNVWKKGLALRGPDTDAMRDPKFRAADVLHFSEYGLRVHAQRWFAAIWSQLYEGR